MERVERLSDGLLCWASEAPWMKLPWAASRASEAPIGYAVLVVACGVFLLVSPARSDEQSAAFFHEREVACRVHITQEAVGTSWHDGICNVERYMTGTPPAHFDPAIQYPNVLACADNEPGAAWPRCATRGPEPDLGWRYPLVANVAATRTYQDPDLDWWAVCASPDLSTIVSDPTSQVCGTGLQEVGRCQASAHYYERICQPSCLGATESAKVFYSFVLTHPDCGVGCYHEPLSAVMTCKNLCRRYLGHLGFNQTVDIDGGNDGEWLDRDDPNWQENCLANDPNNPACLALLRYAEHGTDAVDLVSPGNPFYEGKTPLEICLGNCGPPDPHSPAHVNNNNEPGTTVPCGSECCLVGVEPEQEFCSCSTNPCPSACDPTTEDCCNPRSDCCEPAAGPCAPGTDCCKAKPPWVSKIDRSQRPEDEDSNHWHWTTYDRPRDPHVESLWLRTYGVAGDKEFAPISECWANPSATDSVLLYYCEQVVPPTESAHRAECERNALPSIVDLDDNGWPDGPLPLNLRGQANPADPDAWTVGEEGFCMHFGKAIPFCRDNCIAGGNVGDDSEDHRCGFNLPGKHAPNESCPIEDGICHCPDKNGPPCINSCGNGVLDQTNGNGEDCDPAPGNILDGDCCSAVCMFDLAGAYCEKDGTFCTSGTCDGAGSCNEQSEEACHDGNACKCGGICQWTGSACVCQ